MQSDSGILCEAGCLMGTPASGTTPRPAFTPGPYARERWAVVLAAGAGARLAAALGGARKQYLSWRGAPLYWNSARTFACCAGLDGLVFVFPPADAAERAGEVARLDHVAPLGLPWRTCAGGERRQDSVQNALAVLPRECGFVLVHDAARPFVSAGCVARVLAALEDGAGAVVPAVAVVDTIKETLSTQALDAGNVPLAGRRRVIRTLDRTALTAVQTPQGFERGLLERAYAYVRSAGFSITDDASAVEALGEAVVLTPGEEGNVKITTPGDLRRLQDDMPRLPVTGFGYDVHRYGSGRSFVLGGVPFPEGPELVAHSDGDVLFHALVDAILGCCGGGDIGRLFPDTDDRFEGMASSVFVREALALAAERGVEVVHADLTVIAQTPRLASHAEEVRRNVARLLELPVERVGFKATTEEYLGFTGEKKGIKAVAVVSALVAVRGAGTENGGAVEAIAAGAGQRSDNDARRADGSVEK